MAFDSSKDKTLKSVVVDADRDGQKIEVKQASYNEGPEKVQISRFDDAEEGRKFLRLGRMSMAEAAKVRDALTKIIEGTS